MYIKSINLSNFKGFIGSNNTIEFKYPNGNPGSGLNIFVGENNAGKSTIFEAISFLRDGKGDLNLIKSKLEDGTQDKDTEVSVSFYGNIDEIVDLYAQGNKVNSFKDLIINNEIKAQRSSKEVKKISLWNGMKYENITGIDAPFKAIFETNFIWADTNPDDEASFGASTLCGLLLKEIAQANIETPEYIEFQNMFNKVFNKDSSLRKE